MADIANVALSQAKVKGKMSKYRKKTPWEKMVKALPHLEKNAEKAQEALKRMKIQRKKSLKEDAPANAVGGGHIAGVGIGPQGEPGRRPKGKFAGIDTFIVGRKTFLSLKEAKKKGKHWRKYLEEDDSYAEIREYARKKKGPIVVECEATGACMFVRYGNGGISPV